MNKPHLIFDIKRYSINDGPGIRVTVFFKGCPLRCVWCHNPESWSPEVQKLYTTSRCISCGRCISACPQNALSFDDQMQVVTDATLCNVCGKCAEVCPTHAMELSGRHESVEKIMKAIRLETAIMDQSGGGVTFSGGEPLMHAELLVKLLKQCASEGIHRAVDTSGYADPAILLEVSRYTDLFLYDLKHMDTKEHRKLTGVGNERILDNLKLLCEKGCEVSIRIPLISGINTDELNVSAMAEFIAALPGKPKPVHFLLYHSIAGPKYEKLGRTYHPGDMKEPDQETLERNVAIFQNYGLKVTIGG